MRKVHQDQNPSKECTSTPHHECTCEPVPWKTSREVDRERDKSGEDGYLEGTLIGGKIETWDVKQRS